MPGVWRARVRPLSPTCRRSVFHQGPAPRLQMPKVPATSGCSRSDVLFLWPHALPPVERKLED
eukprot:1161185-Pleurochrysis_carterae.AAC.2